MKEMSPGKKLLVSGYYWERRVAGAANMSNFLKKVLIESILNILFYIIKYAC